MPKAGKKSGVPRELELFGALCLAFANTAVPWRDERRKGKPLVRELATYEALVSWSRRMGILGGEAAEWLLREAAERPDDAKAALAAAHALRTAILRLATGVLLETEPSAKDLEALNVGLASRHFTYGADGFGWAAAADPRALDRMLGPVAQSATELLKSPERLARLRQCAARGCTRLFVYRNKRRRWCDMARCGNRDKGLRHYRKERERKKDPRRGTLDSLIELQRSVERFEEAKKG